MPRSTAKQPHVDEREVIQRLVDTLHQIHDWTHAPCLERHCDTCRLLRAARNVLDGYGCVS